jgi:hypothetical protein
MPATYEPIATTTLGSAANSITFSSITSAYTDLRIVITWTVNSDNIVRVRFNSDSGTNYSATYLSGNGTVAESNRQTNLTYIDAGWNAVGLTTPALTTFDIFSYAGSTNKTVLATQSGDKNGSGSVDRIVGLWRNTSAITSIDVAAVGTTSVKLQAGTVATLYGILKA